MIDGWTFEDRARLLAEALLAKDQTLLERIWWSDEFEPSLGAPGGLAVLIIVTPAEKKAERERIRRLYAERAAIKARWAADLAQAVAAQ